MKIWHSNAVGGPETLTLSEQPDPVASADELLIEVAACGVNFPDSLIIRDQYQFKPPRPFAPGGEVAGTVLAVGERVAGFVPGDRVMARTGWGGLATRVAVPVERCMTIPAAMPFDEAAALLFTYGTSYHALVQRGAIGSGERVLVLGAAGGTGLAAVEIAKAYDAHVVAAVSTPEKAELALACGADETVIYPLAPLDKGQSRALAESFKAALGGEGADIIYDPVGGDYAEPALRSIAWKGRYLVVGFPAGIPSLPFNLPLLKGCAIVGVFNGGFQTREAPLARANADALLKLYEQGKIRPRISRRFSFEEAPLAIAQIEDRGALGKLVVDMMA